MIAIARKLIKTSNSKYHFGFNNKPLSSLNGKFSLMILSNTLIVSPEHTKSLGKLLKSDK